ncbi:nucleotidyltransferase [Methylovulum psychrotolerans]|uniref:Nucleotidyltransferase n=1 Tax=Methylovulum psychrotolerans TaxID=1704499 RepID=A0A1Z4C2Q9_9GAMM|nr:nucleotidyltransferase [Methylovulum psychrotolerans]ASF47827.1 nucleotidyltransferase [Methylovulum psychrotolerans]
MASTVISAFNEFLKDTVNLDADDVKSARISRTLLKGKIHDFPIHDSSFPALYSEKDINFGSFDRNTKKRLLDDIDMMICLNAMGGTYLEYSHDNIEITIDYNEKNLKYLCNPNTYQLNSIKVVNKFVSSLSSVSQYKNSQINRRQEAAVLNLTSYDWSFDIVPCFFTREDSYGKTFYLIPNGSGSWKKTDPRIDQEKVSDINQKNKGNVLNVIRIMKFWNKRPTMPSMSSYLIENMILNYYEYRDDASNYVDMELPNIFLYIRNNVYNSVQDPKGIQGNINHLTYDEKSKIWDRANFDYDRSVEARSLEDQGKQKESINKWREIFGSEFPTYW